MLTTGTGKLGENFAGQHSKPNGGAGERAGQIASKLASMSAPSEIADWPSRRERGWDGYSEAK